MENEILQKPVWLKLNENELKQIITELMEKEPQPAKIGLILRDQYGIPTTRVYGKKLLQIMKELGYTENAELKNTEKKLEIMKAHFKDHKATDKKTKHKIQKAQSRLNIVKKYWEKETSKKLRKQPSR